MRLSDIIAHLIEYPLAIAPGGRTVQIPLSTIIGKHGQREVVLPDSTVIFLCHVIVGQPHQFVIDVAQGEAFAVILFDEVGLVVTPLDALHIVCLCRSSHGSQSHT